MRYIYVNLKRFDILKSLGGVNDLPAKNKENWAKYIFSKLSKALNKYSKLDYRFVFYLPEAYIISALKTLDYNSPIKIGCQSVYSKDVLNNSNIGAFTSLRPASSMTSLGVKETIIGHSEERKAKSEFLAKVSSDHEKNDEIVNQTLQEEINRAQSCGLNVLYCIGEDIEARKNNTWKEVIKSQLNFDKSKVDINKLIIAYEPIWAIGPNRPVPDAQSIKEVGSFIHQNLGLNVPILYGGGLKEENAEEIANIPDINGGLIALTEFTKHVGFYPDQFLSIVNKYIKGVENND